MRIFSVLYDKALYWAAHRHASWYLGALSCGESFLPLPPPDVMLAPMTLARLDRAWRYAFIASVTSVIGGVVGYMIGLWGIHLVEPFIQQWGYWDKYTMAQSWFNEWGVWVVFIAGFSPVPYKLFTISAGAIGMAFVPFVLASLIGRGARFFLVAGLVKLGGERMEHQLKKYVEYLGWGVVILIVLFLLLK